MGRGKVLESYSCLQDNGLFFCWSVSGSIFVNLHFCISISFFYCTCQFNFFVFVNLGRKKVKKAEKEAVIVPGQWPLSQHVTYTVCTTRIRCHFQLILRRIYYFPSIILVLILVMLMPDDNDNSFMKGTQFVRCGEDVMFN